MGRMYSVVISAASVSAAVDAFEITGAASKVLRIHEIKISQSSDAGDAQSEQIRVTAKRFTGAYTSGSGGSAPTPRPFNPSDAAAAFTAETGNTTQATGGTSVTLLEDSFNVLGPGWHYLPTPESRIEIAASSALVVSITAPADALTVNGYAIVEEIG